MKHILFIENNKTNQAAFKLFSKTSDFPYSFEIVGSILEATKAFQNNTFHAIVSNFIVDKSNALEILDLKIEIPLVVLMNAENEKKIADVLKKGVSGCLIKDPNGSYLKLLEGTIQNAIHKFQVKKNTKDFQTNLEDYSENLTDLNHFKTSYLQNISYKIRTKMNGVIGFSHLLKTQKLSKEKQHAYLEIIIENGYHILNIIDNLNDISLLEIGQVEVNYSDTIINDELESLYAFFKPETANKGITLNFNNIPFSKEIIIKTDREKLHNILANLIRNAIKYCPQGSIDVGFTQNTNSLEFYVKDTGIGISKEKKETIFDGIVKNNKIKSDTLLALSISKSHVEMLGGKIWVTSDKGKGSQFYFTIPYKTAKFKEVTSQNKTENFLETKALIHKNKSLKNIKVLIAEDDKYSFLFLTIILEDICSEIFHAKTGKEAVEFCLKNADLDLVLMDIKMPVMDGYEATHEIRKFNKNLIIIAQTAFVSNNDIEMAYDAGCNEYISKPIDGDHLIALMENFFIPDLNKY